MRSMLTRLRLGVTMFLLLIIAIPLMPYIALAQSVVHDTVQVAAPASSNWFSGLVGVIVAAIVSAVASYFGGNHGAAKGADAAVARNSSGYGSASGSASGSATRSRST